MRRFRLWTVVLLLGGVGLALASRHPLWPIEAALFVLVMATASAWRPRFGIVLFAALLPIVDQTIHTGPWLADELDLMVLGALAGGLVRLEQRETAPHHGPVVACWPFLALSAGVLLAGLPGLWWTAAGVVDGGLDTLATVWRASKAFVWAMLLVPLWWALCGRHTETMLRQWALGCTVGLVLASGAVLWELALQSGHPLAMPGYRTAGWFWEMRLGGGAIDVYLAVTAPLVLGALVAARTRMAWWAMALVLVAAFQVLVSTQSRALMVAVGAAVMVAAWSWRWHRTMREAPAARPGDWRFLTVLIGIQVAWGLVAGSGLSNRLGAAVGDFGHRVLHWQRALATLPVHHGVWTGVGAGQLPERYGRVPGPGEFAGRLDWVPGGGSRHDMRLSGPLSDPHIGHLFAAGQRLQGLRAGHHTARLRLTITQPVTLLISVCERHLIYDRRCQWRRQPVAAADGGEPIELEVGLRGDRMVPDALLAPWRPAWFAVSVLTPGASVHIHRIELVDALGHQRLANSGFEQGPVHWMSSAQGRFEPWHVDNFYLEFLVERGLAGLVCLMGLLFLALRAACLAQGHTPWAMAYLASTVALGLLGLLISVAEMPRLALLVWITLGMATLMKPKTSHKIRM